MAQPQNQKVAFIVEDNILFKKVVSKLKITSKIISVDLNLLKLPEVEKYLQELPQGQKILCRLQNVHQLQILQNKGFKIICLEYDALKMYRHGLSNRTAVQLFNTIRAAENILFVSKDILKDEYEYDLSDCISSATRSMNAVADLEPNLSALKQLFLVVRNILSKLVNAVRS